jgi:glycosyltransferase involved in cell wall biosynthesis
MTLPISVIIPVYKQEHWVFQAVESAMRQSNDVTVIVDGEVSNHLYAEIGQLCTVYSTGGGFRAGVCYARNMGIDAAFNDLIFPLDADDRLYPDTLERMHAAWKPGTWVYGNYTEITEDERDICERYAPPPGMIFRKNLTYSSFLFAKEDWLKVGGYDVNFEFGDEDMALQVALVDAGVKPIRLEGAPLYKRMIHPNGSRTEQAMKYWLQVMDMLRTKYPRTMKP